MNDNTLNVSRGKEEFPGKAMAPDPHVSTAGKKNAKREELEDDESQALQALQADIAEEEADLPEDPDCSSDALPLKTEPKAGKKTLLLPDLVSMWKYMLCYGYANRRLALYSFLNLQLRRGDLSGIVGFKVLNHVINKEVCEFNGVTFWKIDRESFYADVKVTLKLRAPDGVHEWNGILTCWCSFDDGFELIIEGLSAGVERGTDDDLVMLNPFLVPYMTSKQMDEFAEQLWIKYDMPGALKNPTLRKATELAKRMGLQIMYLDVYEHQDMDSIIFFEDSDLIVGEDRIIREPDGSTKHIKTGTPTTAHIPANTIVVNTNRIRRDYSAFNIFHECIHFEMHYMFFRLQQMGSNDIRLVKTIEKEVEEGKELKDPIFFMENQADRGAYGLMMPATDTRERVHTELGKVKEYKNAGDLYEQAGKELSRQLVLPHFRVKPRMVQLGFTEAKGALNYVDRKLIAPFAFDPDSWRESDVTFVVKPGAVSGMRSKNEDFKAIMESGRYIYADGHVVRNDPRFVVQKGDQMYLTDEAAKHVDDCCLRFVRRYVQQNVGRYVMGRMFHDPHLIEQTNFYLSDIMNQKQLDDLDAKQEYKDSFPRKFVDAFDLIMEKNDETRESTAYRLHISTDTLDRWLADPVNKITADFIIRVSLMWQVPDFISKMLLDRASIHLSEYDRRQRALEYIRTILWDQGIGEANKYLTGKNLALLDTYETEKIESRKRRRKLK